MRNTEKWVLSTETYLGSSLGSGLGSIWDLAGIDWDLDARLAHPFSCIHLSSSKPPCSHRPFVLAPAASCSSRMPSASHMLS